MVISMERWVGKVAVVTGASSGIGVAIVDHLVKEGVIVVGIARRVELVQKQAETLKNAKGKLYALKADISNDDEVVKAFKWITDNVGIVHILVNNAGVSFEGPLTEGKTEDWQKTFNLNVIGLCTATREAVKIMKSKNVNGHIIHINSLLGHRILPVPGQNVYPASKFAVTALTETLRQELNHLGLKIKVTSLSPGLVATEFTKYKKTNSTHRQAFYDAIKMLEPEDIADGLIYALSTPEHVQVHEVTIIPMGQ